MDPITAFIRAHAGGETIDCRKAVALPVPARFKDLTLEQFTKRAVTHNNNGLRLTREQKAAVLYAAKISVSKGVGLLCGKAGTGKSTVTLAITQVLRCDLLAPTNAAALVLRQKTGKPARTIASAMERPVGGGLRLDRGVFVQAPPHDEGLDFVARDDAWAPEGTQLVLVDEAGMVDADKYDTIMAYANGCGVLFLGDPNQLRPVKASGSVLDMVLGTMEDVS